MVIMLHLLNVLLLVKGIRSILDISNNGISKYPLISKNIDLTYFLFLFISQLLLSQTTDMSKQIFCDQKIYFEISIVWDELDFDLQS